MNILLIGGTGTISTDIVKLLARRGRDHVTLVNRGSRAARVPEGVRLLVADARDESALREAVAGRDWDCVCEFIAFKPDDAARDLRVFGGHTRQYIFISSASAYQKPVAHLPITESTPLRNPFWQYSRDKAACEALLMDAYAKEGFPVTIVRPSHTYSEWTVPVAVHGAKGSWQVLRRMLDGKGVPVPGDGTSLWTFTHSRDFARAFVELIGNPHALGQAVHITSDERMTWNAAYGVLGDCLGVTPRLLHRTSEALAEAGKAYGYDFAGSLLGDKAECAWFDNTKIKTFAPGWSAAIRYDQGMRESVATMLAHPEMQVEDGDFNAFCDAL